MNIAPQTSFTPLATVVNPQTDSLRRENHQREVITQPAAMAKSAAEKGVASDKDKAKTPAQQNEQIDFNRLKQEAEARDVSINGDPENSEQSSSHEQHTHSNGEEHKSSTESAEEFAEQQEIKELQQRDLEVRSHELAHAAVGGAYTGAPSYTFEVGPDGKKYAVSGEVSVDLSVVEGNPRATIAKMQKIHAAALAPANPSVQDTRIAAAAAKIIIQAQSELAAANLEDADKPIEPSDHVKPDDVFNSGGQASEFDTFINQTLKAQEEVVPTRPVEVIERAGRIESFYSSINVAYEKPSQSNFQLTA